MASRRRLWHSLLVLFSIVLFVLTPESYPDSWQDHENATSIATCSTTTSGGALYVGLGGVAWALMELADATNHVKDSAKISSMLSPACDSQMLLQTALNYTKAAMGRDLMPRHVTLLEGRSGLLALLAILQHKMGNEEACSGSIQELEAMYTLEVQGLPDAECEVLYGRAGYLASVLLAAKRTGRKPRAGIVRGLVSHILEAGRRTAAETVEQAFHKLTSPKQQGFPLMYRWHDKYYLGGIHGLAGVCYVLLCAVEALSADRLEPGLMEDVGGAAHALVQAALLSGNLPPSLGSSSDRLVQLCHGAPGLVLLLCKCQEVLPQQFSRPLATEPIRPLATGGFPDKPLAVGASSAHQLHPEAEPAGPEAPAADEYVQHALRFSDVVWDRGLLKKGVGLCHGIAGNAYCFLACHRAAAAAGLEKAAEEQLHRAQHFGLFAAQHWKRLYSVPDRPMSLYEGLSGAIALWSHLLPSFREDWAGGCLQGRMPGFEI